MERGIVNRGIEEIMIRTHCRETVMVRASKIVRRTVERVGGYSRRW